MTTPTAEPNSPTRVTALDGLRGLAALVVLLHHSLLAIPEMTEPYFHRAEAYADHGVVWWLSFTPLHLFWAGGEAVFLFFVISGMALSLRGWPRSLSGYFASRAVRLYLPVWAVVVSSAAALYIWPLNPTSTLSAWLAHGSERYGPARVLADLVLVDGTSGVLSHLWSLRWEVVFSVTLPVFLVLFRDRRYLRFRLAVLAGVMVVGGVLGAQSLMYLPMFALGVLLATHRDEVAHQLSSWSRPAWAAAWTSALLGLTIRWWFPSAAVEPRVFGALLPVVAFSATGLVALATAAPGANRLFDSPVFRHLGVMSFSLYLVHEPLVVRIAYLGHSWNPGVTVVVGILGSLIAAEVFLRVCERPCHLLARRIDRRARDCSREETV